MNGANITRLHSSLHGALNAGDGEQLQALALQITEHAAADFPAFHAILNALGYHNRLSLINEMMLLAWPQVQEDRSYSRPAVEAYAARATDHLIYAFLEDQPQPADVTMTRELVDRLERYFPVEVDRLQSYLKLLSGDVGRRWSAEDFESLEMPSLGGLIIECLGHSSRANVPYARAHLFRELFPRYLLDRQAGNLQPKPDMAAALRQGRRTFPQPLPEPLHLLAPDQPSLTLFMQRMLQTAYPQPYAAAAILILLPYWLNYLELRELIPQNVAAQSKTFLPDLHRELAPFWADHPDEALRAISSIHDN